MKKIALCLALVLIAVPAYAQDQTTVTTTTTTTMAAPATSGGPYRVAVPVPGAGRATCYGPTEAEAEQGIRIHSELMVIALNCQHMTPRGWKNFYHQYQEITARQGALIAGYENVMIDYFGRAGRPNPERALHDLRTVFANKVSNDAAQMRPDIFCSRFAPRLPKVEKMSTAEFKGWAADYRNGPKPTEPLCR